MGLGWQEEREKDPRWGWRDGAQPEKSHTKMFSNQGLYREKLQVCCFSRLARKCLGLVVTGGTFFSSDRRGWKLLDFFPRAASPARLLPGPLVGGFIHPLRGSIFVFTGGGRCGDRISPAFGSVVNVLVILGHVWGFWSGYPSTLLLHALPAPSACSASGPVRGYIWDQNTPDSEHPRSRVG